MSFLIFNSMQSKETAGPTSSFAKDCTYKSLRFGLYLRGV